MNYVKSIKKLTNEGMNPVWLRSEFSAFAFELSDGRTVSFEELGVDTDFVHAMTEDDIKLYNMIDRAEILNHSEIYDVMDEKCFFFLDKGLKGGYTSRSLTRFFDYFCLVEDNCFTLYMDDVLIKYYGKGFKDYYAKGKMNEISI